MFEEKNSPMKKGVVSVNKLIDDLLANNRVQPEFEEYLHYEKKMVEKWGFIRCKNCNYAIDPESNYCEFCGQANFQSNSS